MKVLVIGDKMFVGAAVVDATYAAGHEVIAEDGPLIHGASPGHIATLLDMHAPNVIVNCVSELVNDARPLSNMFKANILLPHALAAATQGTSTRIFQVSTPHVFDGLLAAPWMYTTGHRTNPSDYFGRSRALGEVIAPHVTVVRCDALAAHAGYVQRTLKASHVVGWTRVWWNGGFADDIAKRVVGLFGVAEQPSHVVHIAMKDGLTRYALAGALLRAAGIQRKVEESAAYIYNRMLIPTPGLELPDIEEALETHKERLTKNACNTIAHLQPAGLCQADPAQHIEEPDSA